MTEHKRTIYEKYVKRIFDFLLALLLSVPALFVVSVCYAAIKLETKGTAFFVQDRPGYRGKLFRIYKLRTMITETERDGKPLSDAERLTKIGKIIRALSFDELPQLLNILRGEMSFIGPRPLLAEYLEHYDERQKHRHDVLPGMSGWAQVNGRNTISWEQKFEYDLYYVEHISFLMDLKVLGKTVKNVFTRKDINAGTEETMPAWMGNERNV